MSATCFGNSKLNCAVRIPYDQSVYGYEGMEVVKGLTSGSNINVIYIFKPLIRKVFDISGLGFEPNLSDVLLFNSFAFNDLQFINRLTTPSNKGSNSETRTP